MRKRTKALSIPKKVKEAVAKRDSVDGYPCCIICGNPAPTDNPLAFSCAHYISRAQGGLGIEENILTLCTDCHRRYDGEDRELLIPSFQGYLSQCYPDWSEDKLVYRKDGVT